MRTDEKILYHSGWVIAVGMVLLGAGQVYLGVRFQRTTDAFGAELYTWSGGVVAVSGLLFLLWWFSFVRSRHSDRGD